MEEIKVHSVETVSEVSQKSNVKIVTHVKRKTWSKGQANFKNIAGQVLTYNSKNFHWLKKLDLKRTMNGLEKAFRQKSDPKSRKNSKNQSEIVESEQKTTRRKRIFAQTPFSHSTSNLERKNFTPQNHSLFRSISCFGVTKITTPIWLQKSWKCVNISWKKHGRTSPDVQFKEFSLTKPKNRPRKDYEWNQQNRFF